MGQNFDPAGIGVLHFGHGVDAPAGAAGAIVWPQAGQNRLPAGTSAPHFGQGVDPAAPPAIPGDTAPYIAPPIPIPAPKPTPAPTRVPAPPLGFAAAVVSAWPAWYCM